MVSLPKKDKTCQNSNAAGSHSPRWHGYSARFPGKWIIFPNDRLDSWCCINGMILETGKSEKIIFICIYHLM